jgi:hypothetical protein
MNFVEDEALFYDNVLSLCSLSGCLRSLLRDGTARSEETIEEMIDLYVSVEDALELLSEFDKIEDNDFRDDVGYRYSEIVVDIEDMLVDINKESGINLFIH